MNVAELYHLTGWIGAEITGKRIPKLYTALHAVLEQNTQPNQQKHPFDEQKTALTNVLQKIPLTRLSLAQISFLHKLGIAPYIGNDGIAYLEDILVHNPIDPATASSKVQHIVTSLTKGIEKANALKNALEGCVETEDLPPEEVLIRVNFSKDAAMHNIADLKQWGSVWHAIGRGIAIIHDLPPENIRIIGASNGSVLLDLGVTYVLAQTVSMIMNKALDIAERIVDIRGKAEGVRSLHLANNKIASELEKEAKKVNDEGVEKIVNDVFSELGLGKSYDGEKRTAFTKAVGHLINFLSKGGEVDCVLPEQEETAEESEGEETPDQTQRNQLAALRESFQQIRDHSAKLRVLEHVPQQDENEEP